VLHHAHLEEIPAATGLAPRELERYAALRLRWLADAAQQPSPGTPKPSRSCPYAVQR